MPSIFTYFLILEFIKPKLWILLWKPCKTCKNMAPIEKTYNKTYHMLENLFITSVYRSSTPSKWALYQKSLKCMTRNPSIMVPSIPIYFDEDTSAEDLTILYLIGRALLELITNFKVTSIWSNIAEYVIYDNALTRGLFCIK